MPYCRAHPVLQNSKIKSLYELSAPSYLILNLENIWILKSTEKRKGANEKFEYKEKEKYLKIFKFHFFHRQKYKKKLIRKCQDINSSNNIFYKN